MLRERATLLRYTYIACQPGQAEVSITSLYAI